MKKWYIITASIMACSSLFVSCEEDTKKRKKRSSSSTENTTENTSSGGYLLYSEEQQLPIGTTLTLADTLTMKDVALEMVSPDEKGVGTMSSIERKAEVRTIDSKTQVTAMIIRDELEGSFIIEGRKIPQPDKKNPLHGKTLVFKKVDKSWTADLKEGSADEKTQKAIDARLKQWNDPSQAAMFGLERRKVGDTWNVDPSKLSLFADNKGEKPTGDFKMTFDSIRKHDGHECAVLIGDMDVTGRMDDGQMVSLKGKSTVFISLEYLISLSHVLEAQMQTVPGDSRQEVGVSVKVKGPLTGKRTVQIKLPE